MSKENKGISKTLVIIIIAIVVIICIGGIYYYATRNHQELPKKSTAALSVQPVNNNAISQPAVQTNNSNVKNMSHTVTIKTNMGNISFVTYDADAPNTVKNFITLADKGFYNGLIFHRVIPGFMIQGGDPAGTGTGGPGYTFADELNPNTASYKAGYQTGVVAMANAGPNTNGSQFFIMVANYPLPNNYTIFGKVVSGQDVADAISKVPTGQNNLPISKVIMEKVTVADNTGK